MPKFGNRVRETTTSVGVGSIDLAGKVAGFRPFMLEFDSGDQVYYLIQDDSPNPSNYEYGIGTITAGSADNPDSLSRDTVEGSSNNDELVSFPPGRKIVTSTPTAAALGGVGPISGGIITGGGGSGGASNFLDLLDVEDYSTHPGEMVVVNGDGDGLTYAPIPVVGGGGGGDSGIAIEDFGAVAFDPRTTNPSSATNSGPAIQAALQYSWQNLVTIGARGSFYRVGSPISTIINQHTYPTGNISAGTRVPFGLDLGGAHLWCTFSTASPVFSIGANSIISMLRLGGFSIRGAPWKGIYLYARTGAPNAGGSFVMYHLHDISIQSCGHVGIHLHGEVFEGECSHLQIRNTGAEGFVLEHGSTNVLGAPSGNSSGVPSSNYLTHCNISFSNSHGVRVVSPAADLRMSFIDFISNEGAAVSIENGNPGDLISSCHMENSYTGTASSTSLGHIRVGNAVDVIGCRFLGVIGGARAGVYIPSAVNDSVMISCLAQQSGNILATANGTGFRLKMIGCRGSTGGGSMPRDVV